MLLDTPICNYNWQAPPFSLKDACGTNHNMQDYLGNKGVVIAFICNHCPYVQRIAQNLKTDTDMLIAEGINVLAVMSNDYQTYPEDSPANMQKFAQRFDFHFPYLIDADQKVAKQYDAVCTPDFFGLNSEGLLQYRGRLDNMRMADNTDRDTELLNAMRQIAVTGRGPIEQHPSMGCSIKWREVYRNNTNFSNI